MGKEGRGRVAGRGLYEHEGFPDALLGSDFSPNTLQVMRSGQLGMQDFFSIGRRRIGVLYVVIGSRADPEPLLAEATALIRALEFATTPEGHDFRPVPRRKR